MYVHVPVCVYMHAENYQMLLFCDIDHGYLGAVGLLIILKVFLCCVFEIFCNDSVWNIRNIY